MNDAAVGVPPELQAGTMVRVPQRTCLVEDVRASEGLARFQLPESKSVIVSQIISATIEASCMAIEWFRSMFERSSSTRSAMISSALTPMMRNSHVQRFHQCTRMAGAQPTQP
jgi:hypothetical protein